jgi:hypothetical protein
MAHTKRSSIWRSTYPDAGIERTELGVLAAG